MLLGILEEADDARRVRVVRLEQRRCLVQVRLGRSKVALTVRASARRCASCGCGSCGSRRCSTCRAALSAADLGQHRLELVGSCFRVLDFLPQVSELVGLLVVSSVAGWSGWSVLAVLRGAPGVIHRAG